MAMEQARQDGLAEARRAHEQARLQVQLDRDALEQRAREAELRATQRDEDRKAERQEAMLLRQDENRRFEAVQAASKKSRQVFEAAMLAVLANMGRGSS